jgi:putative endonuclease
VAGSGCCSSRRALLACHPERSEGPARMRPAAMYVYVLSSRTRRLYVGVTNDLVRRVWQHRDGTVRGFTRKYSIDRLVYYEPFNDPIVAIRREKQIKSWSRVKKLALVESMNPSWIDCAEHWFPSARPADPSLRSG